MIELLVKEQLESLGLPIFFEHSESNHETKFLIIEKTSGGEAEYIKSATMIVQSYAPSLFEAAQLNEQVKAEFKKIISQNQICKVELNSDYNFTDLESKRYRYQAVFDINYY